MRGTGASMATGAGIPAPAQHKPAVKPVAYHACAGIGTGAGMPPPAGAGIAWRSTHPWFSLPREKHLASRMQCLVTVTCYCDGCSPDCPCSLPSPKLTIVLYPRSRWPSQVGQRLSFLVTKIVLKEREYRTIVPYDRAVRSYGTIAQQRLLWPLLLLPMSTQHNAWALRSAS